MPIQIYENERVLRLVDPDDLSGKIEPRLGIEPRSGLFWCGHFLNIYRCLEQASTGVLLFSSIPRVSGRRMVGQQLRVLMQRISPVRSFLDTATPGQTLKFLPG